MCIRDRCTVKRLPERIDRNAKSSRAGDASIELFDHSSRLFSTNVIPMRLCLSGNARFSDACGWGTLRLIPLFTDKTPLMIFGMVPSRTSRVYLDLRPIPMNEWENEPVVRVRQES